METKAKKQKSKMTRQFEELYRKKYDPLELKKRRIELKREEILNEKKLDYGYGKR